MAQFGRRSPPESGAGAAGVMSASYGIERDATPGVDGTAHDRVEIPAAFVLLAISAVLGRISCKSISGDRS